MTACSRLTAGTLRTTWQSALRPKTNLSPSRVRVVPWFTPLTKVKDAIGLPALLKTGIIFVRIQTLNEIILTGKKPGFKKDHRTVFSVQFSGQLPVELNTEN